MARMVQCVVIKREAEGMDSAPYPGDLGQRIFDNVSQEGWSKWLEQLTMIINENGLSTADPRAAEVIEKHMLGFFFNEGVEGSEPESFKPPGGGKK